MRILGKYRITYNNGITQEKNLISHACYTDVISPRRKRINELELAKQKRKANRLKAQLVNVFGEFWFTDRSPLWDAFHTGILQPPFPQGKATSCKIEKI